MTEEVKKKTTCENCGRLFSKENVYSDAGWRETQISGYCEKCFDDITGFEDCDGDLDSYARNVDSDIGNK